MDGRLLDVRRPAMLLYYLWAVAQKTLSYTPFGDTIYRSVGYLANRRKGYNDAFVTSFRLTRKGRDLIPTGGTVLDVGTGWYHHDAFLLWLVGDYNIYLFDVQDKSNLRYIKNYINHLRNNIDLLVEELGVDRDTTMQKLGSILMLRTREEVYRYCNFVPIITKDVDRPFLPDNSIDFMVSNCVLPHIPPAILHPELTALQRMLKPEGRMHFMIGHDDHWTFHDNSANQFNFYRYSGRYYGLIFDTKFEYHNRMVKQEWFRVFEQCGLEVEEYYGHVTEGSREQIAKLPHIDSRFAKYPRDELAIIYSYVLLRKRLG